VCVSEQAFGLQKTIKTPK